ncbi:MAG: hypothetical protein ABSC05_33875 [Candidatus Solibacter sp.]
MAILAVLLGCALRRSELAGLTVEHIQQRDARWVIADLVGKGGRMRTVAVPAEGHRGMRGVDSGCVFWLVVSKPPAIEHGAGIADSKNVDARYCF